MNHLRPGTLAVRAVNQYRRRDVFLYLGLRYYLENSAARSDVWARRIATDLVRSRPTSSCYRVAHHYKELNEHGQPLHRQMGIPGANEALAEAALLAECAKHPKHFGPLSCVFSYILATKNSRSGIFDHYVRGLCLRQDAVSRACSLYPKGLVQYLDIQQFYPSITIEMALRAWNKHATAAGLDSEYHALGVKMIEDHQQAQDPGEPGILTGPMFSHFLANLVLRDLDIRLASELPVRYFRYVDDMILVGGRGAVEAATKHIASKLGEMNLRIHGPDSAKWLQVPTEKWLEGKDDYHSSDRGISWQSLIGDLKTFLLLNPTMREPLRIAFHAEGFRLPIADYSGAVREVSNLDRLIELARIYRLWYPRKKSNVTLNSLLTQARWLRGHYEQEFPSLFERAKEAEGYDRKRILPKLRYLAGKLIYLGSDNFLTVSYPRALDYSELHLHGRVMEAVATRRLDNLLPMGFNVAQAAAQPLVATRGSVAIGNQLLGEAETQSLAVLYLNGVQISRSDESSNADSELIRFSRHGSDPKLMKSADPFLRELACLHGVTTVPRHQQMLYTAFDEDEDIAVDAIDQLLNYQSP